MSKTYIVRCSGGPPSGASVITRVREDSLLGAVAHFLDTVDFDTSPFTEITIALISKPQKDNPHG